MAPRRKIPRQSTDPTLTDVDSMLAEVGNAVDWLGDVVVCHLTGIGGTANAVTATCNPDVSAGLVEGMVFSITFTSANTGAATLTINTEAAIDLLYNDGSALGSGAYAAGSSHLILIDAAGDGRIMGLAPGVSGVLDYQAFTASGTWTKPAGVDGNALVQIEVWGAGGGGSSAARGPGGGGGAYAVRWMRASELTSTVTVTIGAGGAVNTAGGNSTFGSYLTGYGGGAGTSSGTAGGGSGGGLNAAGATAGGSTGATGGGTTGGAGGDKVAPTLPGESTHGGGGGGGGDSSGSSPQNGAASIFGGGGGGGGSNSGAATGNGGASVYGGGGGQGGSGAGSGGTSSLGGAGGASGVAGSARGGGGGRAAAGGRGEIRVKVIG